MSNLMIGKVVVITGGGAPFVVHSVLEGGHKTLTAAGVA